MNLVQIQNRLRDVPIQALMAYANGANPEVPPYLALGEMDRRKRMEKAAQPAEAPQGTVKEQIEQQAGLMALMKARQAQAAQQSAQAPGQQPFVPAQGVPQPSTQPEPEDVEMLMAAGGVTALPVRDEDFEYAGGGIVAFAEGSDKKGVKEKEEDKKELRYVPLRERAREQMEQKGSIYSENFGRPPSEYVESEATRALKAPFRAAAEGVSGLFNSLYRTRPAEGGADIMFGPLGEVLGGTAGASAVAQPSQAALDAAYKKEVANREAAAQAAPPPAAPRVPAAGPAQIPAGGIAGPRPAAAPVAGAPGTNQFLDILRQKANQQAPDIGDYATLRKAAEEANPLLAKQPGGVIEEYIKKQAGAQEDRRRRFEESEKEQARRDFFNALIAGGRASRGTKGIAGALGGFGRASGEYAELGRARMERFEEAMAARDEALMKMSQEIENARIARAEGRFKDEVAHKTKAAELKAQADRMSIEAASAGAQVQQRAEEGVANRANELAKAGIMAAGSGIKAEKQELAELQALQKSLTDQLKTTYKKDEKQALIDQLNVVNARIAKMTGLEGQVGGGAGKKVIDFNKI